MGEEAFRMLRLYLPRTEDRLRQDFDVIVEDGMDAAHLPEHFHHWMKTTVEEEGLGFLMADDSSSFATSGRHTSWYLFPIGDVLPVTSVEQIFYPEHGYWIVVEEENRDHPLMRNIPWETMPRIWAHNRPTEKEGAIVLARMSPGFAWNNNKPVIVYWDFGAGRSMAFVFKWHGIPDSPVGDIPGAPEFYRWKWHVDVLSHLIYLVARVDIPEDLELVHSIRTLFGAFDYRRGYLTSTMEFADRFGANLRQVELRFSKVVEGKEIADSEYLVQDLDGCRNRLEQLISELDLLTKQAIDAKDRALLWIFAVEWLVVSGTSMAVGFVLWTLMVKRKLYREVATTKLVERD